MLYDVDFVKIDDENLIIKYIFSDNTPPQVINREMNRVEVTKLYRMLSKTYNVAYSAVVREEYVPSDALSDEDVEAAMMRIADRELKSLEPLQKISKEIDEDIQDLVDLKRLDEDPESS